MATGRSTRQAINEPGSTDALSNTEKEAVLAADELDTARRAPVPDMGVRRVRAIPAVITRSGDRGTSVEVRSQDFESKGIRHRTVRFDFNRDNFTLVVGNKDGQISKEAADFLTSNYPASFEYIGG